MVRSVSRRMMWFVSRRVRSISRRVRPISRRVRPISGGVRPVPRRVRPVAGGLVVTAAGQRYMVNAVDNTILSYRITDNNIRLVVHVDVHNGGQLKDMHERRLPAKESGKFD